MAFGIHHLVLVYLPNKYSLEPGKYSMFHIRQIPPELGPQNVSPNWEKLKVSLKISKQNQLEGYISMVRSKTTVRGLMHSTIRKIKEIIGDGKKFGLFANRQKLMSFP